MSDTNWTRCRELLAGKDVSPSRVAVACEEIAKCYSLSAQDIVKADPSSALVVSLLGHHLVESARDLENAELAVQAAELVVRVLVAQILSDDRSELTKYQQMRIVASLCMAHDNGRPCLAASELMAVNATLHFSGQPKDAPSSDVPYSKLSAAKDGTEAAADAQDDVGDDDCSFDEDDDEDDEDDGDDTSSAEYRDSEEKRAAEPAPKAAAAAAAAATASGGSDTVEGDDNLDKRSASVLAAFLLKGVSVEKPSVSAGESPPPLPAKPLDLKGQCLVVLREINAVSLLLEKAMVSESLQKCVSSPSDLSPTIISACVLDVQFINTVLALVGVVPLTDGSAELLTRCSDFLTRCLTSVILCQHSQHCKPVQEAGEDSEAAEVPAKDSTTFDGSKLPRFLKHALYGFKTIESSLEKRRKDPLYDENLNIQIFLRHACDLLATAGQVAICKNAGSDPFRCVTACKFASAMVDTLLLTIGQSWKKWIHSGPVQSNIFGETGAGESSQCANAGVAAITHGKLLQSLFTFVTGSCLKATRISSLLLLASEPPAASGRARSGAMIKGQAGATPKARGDGIAAFFSAVSPPLPSRLAFDVTSSSEDEEKLFLDELMSTMPADEEGRNASKEKIPPVDRVKDVVSEVLAVGEQGLLTLKTILKSNDATVTEVIRKNLAAWQLLSLGDMISEMEIIGMLSDKEVTVVHEQLLPKFGGFASRLMDVSYVLLLRNYLTEAQRIALMASLGFSLLENGSWALRGSAQRVSIMAHVLVHDQESGGSLAARALVRFVLALKKEVFTSTEAPLGATDVGVAHYQLMLMLFHGLPLSKRQELFTNLVKILIDASKQEDLCQKPPLVLMRVLQFVDYLLYHFEFPPKDLAEQVKNNLFKLSYFGMPKHHSAADYPPVPLEQDRCRAKTSRQAHVNLLIDMMPRFYNLRPAGAKGQREPNAQAVSFLRSFSGERYGYGDFYRALVSLLAAGSLLGAADQLPTYRSQTQLATACVRSAVHYAWMLLCALPIPCSSLIDIGDSSAETLGVLPAGSFSSQAMAYLCRVIFCRLAAVRLNALNTDDDQEKFSVLAQESSGQYADTDICLSIVVMAQEEVSIGQKGAEAAFSGFEGCFNMLNGLDKQCEPAPLLLLAMDLSLWQLRLNMDAWFAKVRSGDDGACQESTAETCCGKAVTLATRALPLMSAFSRLLVLRSGQACCSDYPPPPLPRSRGDTTSTTAVAASTSSTLSVGSIGPPAMATTPTPSTPTNPVPLGVDTAAHTRLSLILAQARNLTGALSGMASAIEALSTSPPDGLTSSAMDILDELDSYRTSVSASEASQVSDASVAQGNLVSSPSPVQPISDEQVAVYDRLLQLGVAAKKGQSISHPLSAALPQWLQTSLQNWRAISLSKYPSYSESDHEEKDLTDFVLGHLSSMAGVLIGSHQRFNVSAAIRHTIQSLVEFCKIAGLWCENEQVHSLVVNSVVPLMLDATAEPIASNCFTLLGTILGSNTSEFKSHISQFIISMYFDVILAQRTAACSLPEKVSKALFSVPAGMVESSEDIQHIENYFTGEGDVMNVLMLSALPHIDGSFTCQVLSFFSKYCAEKAKDKSGSQLSKQLSRLPELEHDELVAWIRRLFITLQTDDFNRPRDSFLDFVLELVASSAVDVPTYTALLKALIPIGDELLASNMNISFSLFVHCASSLADACGADGHVALCTAATAWLASSESELLNQMKDNDDTGVLSHPMLDSVTQLMRYLSNLSAAIKVASGRYQSDVALDMDHSMHDMDGDWVDDIHDEEESEEESEDEALHNKLCTFTSTQREYAKQHWYHCYTCNFVGHTGICTTCARVCHKGHDLVYAKCGSFFCDCGAKPDGCKALSKRAADASNTDAGKSAFDSSSDLPAGTEAKGHGASQRSAAAQRSAPSQPPAHQSGAPTPRVLAMAKVIESCKDQLIELMNSHGTTQTVLHLVQTLLPRCVAQGQSILSQHGRSLANKAVEELHSSDKVVEANDSLVLPTAGSTEGLFDNVRVQFNGEQGNVIRQLLNSSVIKRSAMCSVTSQRGKKQHVAVNPEKGKITTLQVSGLLRQFDSQRRKAPASGEQASQGDTKRRKVTTRMTSTSVPFTVLSLTSNPVNDEYVAVCGHRDLHVLSFSTSSPGPMQQHITLHPGVEGNNCIIKALWIPGSQTQLAVITSDFIKIWDLCVDALSPMYNFVLPSGKVIDATVMVVPGPRTSEDDLVFVVMSNSGHVYVQPVDENCRASFGPFYLTSALALESPDLPMSSGQVAGGGISIYYSHCIQLLFFSFQNGKTFAARLGDNLTTVKKLFPIPLKSFRSPTSPALYQWLEVQGHPGLVCALTVNNNTPVVLMVEPEKIIVCETKAMPSKSKIQGIVGVRHSSSASEYRTALMVLCEDGALRLFGVDPSASGFWTQPAFHVASPLASLQPVRQQKPAKSARCLLNATQPVDYFENLTAMNDIEFGGNDILQVYSAQQAKHRLTVSSQYLASTKSSGFTVDVTNTNNSMVMCACRLQLGGQYSSDRTTPTFITVFDRPVSVAAGTRLRWFDIPFTREEAMQAQKKFSVTIGPSLDPNGVTIVHSIRVFGKTKEALGWSDDMDDGGTTGGNSLVPTDADGVADQQHSALGSTPSCVPITTASRFLASSLEVLECHFATVQPLGSEENMLGVALSTATALLVAPMPPPVTTQTHCLLAALHPTRQAFHVHKDQAQLAHVARCLQAIASLDPSTPVVVEGSSSSSSSEDVVALDVSTFEHLLAVARTVAVARPTNLFQFAHSPACHRALGLLRPGEDHVSDSSGGDGVVQEPVFVRYIMQAFWKLLDTQPSNYSVLPVWHSGMRSVESVVTALVQILLCFISSDNSLAACLTSHLVDLLLSMNSAVGFACRRAIVMAVSPAVKRKASASAASATVGDAISAASERASSAAASALSDTPLRQSDDTPPLPPTAERGSNGSSTAAASASDGPGRGRGSRRGVGRGRFQYSDSPSPGGDRTSGLLAAALGIGGAGLPSELQGLSSAEAASIMELLEDEASLLQDADGVAGGGGGAAGGSGGDRNTVAAHLDALFSGGAMQQEDVDSLAHMVGEDDSMLEMALALSMQDGNSSGAGSVGSGSSGGRSRASLPSASSRSYIQQALQTGNFEQLSQLAQIAGLDVQSFAQSLAQQPLSAGGSDMHMEAGSHASQDVEVGSLGSAGALHQLVSDHASSHAADVASTSGDVLSLPESSQDAVDNDVASSDEDDAVDLGARGARRDSPTSSMSSLSEVLNAREVSDARMRAAAENSEVDSVEGIQSTSASQRASPSPLTSSSLAAAAAATTATTGGQVLCEVVDERDPGDAMMCKQLHSLSLLLMHHLLKNISLLNSFGGLRSIPYLQTLLMLCTRLDDFASQDNHSALEELLETCIGQLAMKEESMECASERTSGHEVKLVLLRLLSVLMSRTRPQGKMTSNNVSMVCHITAQTLVRHNTLDFCLLVLKGLLQHWNSQPSSKESDTRSGSAAASSANAGSSSGSSPAGSLLQAHLSSAVPDMSPFFLKGYVKGHARDVFESFPQLLTEIVLRLAYLIKKILDPDCKDMKLFSEEWATCLAEYLLAPHQVACVRKQVRSLLMLICGSKDKYRQRRDLHTVQSHISKVFNACGVDVSSPGFLTDQRPICMPYNDLLSLIDHLKACSDVATQRVVGWQTFCQQNKDLILQLVQLSLRLVDGVVPLILLLLSCALTGRPSHPAPASDKPSKSSKTESSSAGKTCLPLIERFFETISDDLLLRFTRAFLLDANSTPVRWQAHGLLLALHQNGSPDQQAQLCNILWSLWSDLPRYGRKGAQFVDLLGFFVSCGQLSPEKAKQCSSMAVALLRQQNKIMSNHPNGHIYHLLSDMVDFDGYYLESDPCLVCNNPETPFSVVKLSSIRADSKYTPTTQLVKLAGSYTIARLQLRISDSKRVKMVRTVNLYYNNRSVQSVVELKNKQQLWHHVKQVHLQAGQTEVKMDFPLPVVACNLMIEFADFYVNSQVNPETLQCPRCSAQVPTAPGVCSNCGENVYQCHKCRSINYDEKDPFLCTNCGFSKYAKFDFVLHARTCCAVDPIENEDDRKQAVTTINSLLERADRSYRQLVNHRMWLENQLGGGNHEPDVKDLTDPVQESRRTAQRQQDQAIRHQLQHQHGGSGGSSSVTGVHPNIMSVAHRYCSECRTSFDELSILIQKVLACRKELIEYDNAQQQLDGVDLSALNASSDAQQHLPRSVSSLVSAGGTHGNCYGCASSAVDHCITMLRAAAQSAEVRPLLITEGLIGELMESNLHMGSQQTRHHVKQLLCLLTRNNCHATHLMNNVLCSRVITAVKSYRTMPNLAGSVRNEMDLLRMSVHMEDLCWEQRLRTVFKLFLASNCIHSPVVMDAVSRPCSLILLHVIKLTSKDQAPNQETPSTQGNFLHANTMQWLKRDSARSFETWCRHCTAAKPEPEETLSAHERYLAVKYSQRWKIKVKRASVWNAQVSRDTWLMRTLFCSSSRPARITAWHMIEALCTDDIRHQHMLDLMMSSLGELSHAAQNGREFMMLFQELSSPLQWKLYLTVRGILPHLAELISKEIAKLQELERTNLGSDLSQGTALKMLTELLAQFLKHEPIKQRFKSRLVGAVLDGYLNLRRLIIQRTKMVDETQEMLLKLLEDMTSGTEEETKAFMAICVKTLSKYPMDDLRTPVIIFERLCSIVYPEENEKTDFHLMLEKDPQQEEFLQGRMQGNPYSSGDVGLGPLMRDVKNKICRDCELVALLDDDASMELLVRNKIISLDLPVKDVYKKVWCEAVDGGGSERVMRVVYRMTGLLGDATEEIIKTLGSGSGSGDDDEELFRMGSVLCECSGLEAMLARLEHLPNLVRGQQMVHALLKLFGYALKLKANCQHLIDPARRAVPILLATLNQALSLKQEFCSKVAEQVLSILETILHTASRSRTDMAALTAETSEVGVLLGFIESSFVRSHTPVLHGMMKVIPYLTFGHAESMCELIDHFVPHLNFDVFDEHQSAEDILYMDCFCGIVQGIQVNEQGQRLKSLVLERSIVQHSIDHINAHVPHYAASAGGTADKEWKAFLSKPSLPYIMRLLTGLCKAHQPSRELVSAVIPALHHIEQTSSEGHVGSLAENVLEVLCEDEALSIMVKECREQTRSEKKRRAMAMRQKQLKELGMNVNQHGQVVASVSAVEREMAELVEESGLKCVICLEGYKNQPKKILGIYTFSKRCPLDDNEGRSRKNMGYFTVSHFNVVHYECHMSAVRLARIRDEWESAALQNSNTKCNGLMPIWGPAVSESSFATCLARHNSNIQEFTGVREPSFSFVVHDIRMLLLRFVTERSFSEESGGGGRQSNIHFMPFIVQIALYVITTTRRQAHEATQLAAFLAADRNKWVSLCHGAETTAYYLVLALVLQTPKAWKECRLDMLRRQILQAHARKDSSSPIQCLASSEPHEYQVYKPMLCLFAMVDRCQTLLKANVDFSDDDDFPQAFLTWMRHNDMAVLESCDKVLSFLWQDLKDCESLEEFFDAAGLLHDVDNPTEFLASLLKSSSKQPH